MLDFNLETKLLAEWMHNNYLELAEVSDWKVQEKTKGKFNQLPEENKITMLLLAERLLELIKKEY
jgi:hypothetical protein